MELLRTGGGRCSAATTTTTTTPRTAGGSGSGRLWMRFSVTCSFDVVANGRVAFVAGVLEHLIAVVQHHGVRHCQRSRRQDRRVLDLDRVVHRTRTGTGEALDGFHVNR